MLRDHTGRRRVSGSSTGATASAGAAAGTPVCGQALDVERGVAAVARHDV